MSLHIHHNGQEYIIEQQKWYSELCQRTCRCVQEFHEQLDGNIEAMAEKYGAENLVIECYEYDPLRVTIKVDNEGNK